ncbi:hypothetical protein SORBI_3001G306101 [Sorghum bicolor]|uniref:RING-type E3 ubiquitin transferase n=1 Tax=Sorghum bicolor TaxID=4558 RepID=A0A1Z5S8Y4_SORBI|nr:hypothetical protein SORBI_3001G306101 [Sorghum bicolor]
MKQEMDALKRDKDDIFNKLVKVSEQKETLEQQVDDYGGIVKDLEDTLAASKSLIHSQKLEYEKVKHGRDNALKDADELCKEKEKTISSCPSLTWNTEFSLSEMKLAIQNFSDTLKVGEGGFGRVYRGLLCNTTVAIKMLRSHNLQEASGLVYEFLPNGSLEDRLACENNTLPLTWQVRTRIIGEICSALIFLHSTSLTQ